MQNMAWLRVILKGPSHMTVFKEFTFRIYVLVLKTSHAGKHVEFLKFGFVTTPDMSNILHRGL